MFHIYYHGFDTYTLYNINIYKAFYLYNEKNVFKNCVSKDNRFHN